MKLGVLTSLLGSLDYEEMLDRVVEAGLEAVELGTGNYPGKAHCNPDELLNDREALKRYKKALKDRALMISALSCHGNPIHPQEEIAQAHHQVFEKTILLAEELEVGVVCLFSGCPGGSKFDKTPNWIAYAAEAGIHRMNTFTGYHTPGDNPVIEAYRVIDCYREVMPVAEEHNVLLCIENHSSVCRDADSLLWLIRAVGSQTLRTNPDPTNFVPEFAKCSDRAREQIYSETERFAQLMSNAHLKIAEFTEDGDHAHVDVRRLLDIFHSVSYNDHIVLEYYGSGDPVEPCAKGVALLHRLMG